MTYRVAIIGAGGMGRRHAQHWRAMPDVEVVGALDIRQDATPIVGEEQAYTDWDTLMTQAKPDVIDICTPTPIHLEYIERAATAGKAIFVEKPLCRTLAECDAAVTAVEKAGVPAMAGHVVRFFPEYAAAKRLVDAGKVGTPAAIRMARLAGLPGAGREHNWFADSAQSGGVVLDMIVHDFDWLRWTFGPVARVFAKGLHGKPAHEGTRDYALVTLRFVSGAVAHVTGSWAHGGGFRTTFEVAGDKGLLEYDSAAVAPLTIKKAASGDSLGAGSVALPESPMAAGEDPYFLELRAFVDTLHSGEMPPVTLADARESARIAFAAQESIETDRVITLAH